MAIRKLLANFPNSFVTRTKIWTPKRNTIEFDNNHDELVGNLIVCLTARQKPYNNDERAAMKALQDAFNRTSMKDKAADG